MHQPITLILLSAWLCTTIHAQQPLTLDSCIKLAMTNNKDLKIAREKVVVTNYEHQAALTNYLPKLSATGSYLFTPKEISLLNERQKEALRNFGTNIQQIATAIPALLPVIQDLPLESSLNAAGSSLAEAFRTDTRHIWTGSITVTQPIYMGGKIKAYDHITRMAGQIAGWQEKKVIQDLTAKVENAFWQVVELTNKHSLAESFLHLVKTLDHNVERMIKAGVATQADGLSVKVKVNEAEMALTRLNNGLHLSRMALCQLCGIDLSTPLQLADEDIDSQDTLSMPLANPDIPSVLNRRPELKTLETVCDIYLKKINLIQADYLPSIALMGGYLVSNPSLYNGFEKKFNGSWNIGILVNIPIFKWGEGKYKVKAAQIEADIMRHELEKAREEVTLQVTQATYKNHEAYKQLAVAQRNLEKANENLRYANLGHQEGVATSFQVMEAQTAWLAAHSARIDAHIALKISEAHLKLVTGY